MDGSDVMWKNVYGEREREASEFLGVTHSGFWQNERIFEFLVSPLLLCLEQKIFSIVDNSYGLDLTMFFGPLF